MARLDRATQPPRVRAANDSFIASVAKTPARAITLIF
jgi:hypothetical protein